MPVVRNLGDGETRGAFNDTIMFWNVLGYEFHAAMGNFICTCDTMFGLETSNKATSSHLLNY
jgi:hypothetical protein